MTDLSNYSSALNSVHYGSTLCAVTDAVGLLLRLALLVAICLAVIRDHVDVMYEVLLKSQLLHLILKRQTLFTLQVNCKHALVLNKGLHKELLFMLKEFISVICLQKNT